MVEAGPQNCIVFVGFGDGGRGPQTKEIWVTLEIGKGRKWMNPDSPQKGMPSAHTLILGPLRPVLDLTLQNCKVKK